MNKKGRFNTGHKSKKGLYTPKNPEKYIGDLSDIMYMSSWELKFMIYCDHRSEILKWGSECFFVPYTMERKDPKTGAIKKTNHKYYPDFYLEVIDPNSPEGFKRLVVEVKPSSEVNEPKPPKKFSTKAMKNFEYAITAYQKNMYKWSKTKEYCSARGMEFMLVTEKHLGL